MKATYLFIIVGELALVKKKKSGKIAGSLKNLKRIETAKREY